MKNILKKGEPYKLSELGHNNFFYPGENMLRASKDIEYTSMSWTHFQGLNPVKVLTEDIDSSLIKNEKSKFSIIWVSV